MNFIDDSSSSHSASNEFCYQLGADLVFTQDRSGHYLSFYWPDSNKYNIVVHTVDDRNVRETFQPVDLDSYLEKIGKILDNCQPERFNCVFTNGADFWHFDLIVSPILSSQVNHHKVLVMGRQLSDLMATDAEPKTTFPARLKVDKHHKMLLQIAKRINRTPPPNSQLYQQILSKIAKNIWRRLDLESIWQQTVQSLGPVLDVSRCIICPYQLGELSSENNQLKIVAEYVEKPISSILGVSLEIDQMQGWQEAIVSLKPVMIDTDRLSGDRLGRQSVLIIATTYQDLPNGIIELHQCDYPRKWQPVEIEFVRELAEQVGMAIGHATLYQELAKAKASIEAVSHLKSQFLANTSHELRTPLNGMIGFLRLILDGMTEDAEEQKEFILEAHRSALHLLNIINDILDISQIEAEQVALELGRIKLSKVLHTVNDLIKPQMQQKKLYLHWEKPEIEDEIYLFSNYQRLLQVMLNLIGNAIKFTHQGGITIKITIKKKKLIFQGQVFPGLVEISISDTGIGVALENQDRLFQFFSQVDGEKTRRYGGTGLGLIISQKLVEAMGGQIHFYSLGEGLGSTATFTILLYQEPVMVYKA